MRKYLVLKEKELESGVTDIVEVYFFDTETEANEKASQVNFDIPEVERDTQTVSVGIVEEEDLEEKGNWDTFTQVDIISVYDRV